MFVNSDFSDLLRLFNANQVKNLSENCHVAQDAGTGELDKG